MVKNYVDVTKEWLDNATPNSHEIEDQLFFEYNEKKYFVDGKNVILDYSEKEREVAEWLRNTFGGKIKMIPRVNYPKNIRTPDYLFRNMKLDLKEIRGKSKRTIENSLKSQKNQANNFILNISNCSLSVNEILLQLNLLYSYKPRSWINIIFLKKNNMVMVLERKRS